MNYQEYSEAFSSARLNKYLKACGENPYAALTLYRHNIKLCQKFYGILNVFEVVLRNAINRHFIAYFSNPEWIKYQLLGMLENSPQRPSIEKTINQLEQSGKYTNDRVVSSLTLGFWTHLFSRRPFALGGQSLLQVFPLRTRGLGQRAVYNELQSIKEFRNRIAHHEAICFDKTGMKNTTYARESYRLIQKYLHFLGYQENHLLIGLDIFPDAILRKIDTLYIAQTL